MSTELAADRLAVAARRLRVAAVIVLVAAFAGAGWWGLEVTFDRRLRERGIHTDAVVGAYRHFRGTPDETRFDYEIAGRRLSVWVDTHHEIELFPLGASVPFVYDPGTPERGRPTRGYIDDVPIVGAITTSLFLGAVSLFWRSGI